MLAAQDDSVKDDSSALTTYLDARIRLLSKSVREEVAEKHRHNRHIYIDIACVTAQSGRARQRIKAFCITLVTKRPRRRKEGRLYSAGRGCSKRLMLLPLHTHSWPRNSISKLDLDYTASRACSAINVVVSWCWDFAVAVVVAIASSCSLGLARCQ